MSQDAGKIGAAQVDNPLYHAMVGGAVAGGPSASHGAGQVNAAYAEGEDGEAMYDEAGAPT